MTIEISCHTLRYVDYTYIHFILEKIVAKLHIFEPKILDDNDTMSKIGVKIN